MILEFSIENFASFKDKVTFSMLADSSTGLEGNYFLTDGRKILKTAAIYGANASGKTNIFRALTAVVYMLRNSNNFDVNDELLVFPFKFDKKSATMPSKFEIKFIVDNIRYVYGFSADEKKIYDEYLYHYPNNREAKIFDRTDVNHYSFPASEEKFLKDIAKKNIDNKFFLATATNWNYDKTKKAYDFLTEGIWTCFDIEDLKKIAFELYAINYNHLKEFALDFLKKADFNIEDYVVSKIDVPQELLTNVSEKLKNELNRKKTYQILFKHKGSDNFLSFDGESLGTQMIFILIPFISDTLNSKKVLVIDELDKSLHPFLVEYIVNIFNDPEMNKNGAQLIFNTHDTNLLNLNNLRRDQIWFTEKNNETGTSDLYQLNDFSVRKQENIEKGYLLGRYGAVPFIRNDINLWEKD